MVVTGASDPSPFKYLAPYAGCAMGQHWMETGAHARYLEHWHAVDGTSARMAVLRAVDTGADACAEMLFLAGPYAMHLRWPRDGRQAGDADTALAAPRGTPKDISKVEYGEFVDADGVRRVRASLTAQFGFDEANDPSTPLREAGLFNDADVLYSRVVFQPVTKTDTFQLTLLWEIVF